MTKFNYKSNILLLLAAVIWGVAFVAQDIASKMLESFAINGCRCIIAFLFLEVNTKNVKKREIKRFVKMP